MNKPYPFDIYTPHSIEYGPVILHYYPTLDGLADLRVSININNMPFIFSQQFLKEEAYEIIHNPSDKLRLIELLINRLFMDYQEKVIIPQFKEALDEQKTKKIKYPLKGE